MVFILKYSRSFLIFSILNATFICSCSPKMPVIDINLERNQFAVKEPGGGLLWRTRFEEKLNDKINPLICDIEGDGLYEVLASTSKYDMRHAGYLFLFDHLGNKLWSMDFSSEIFKVPYYQAGELGDKGPKYLFFPSIQNIKVQDIFYDEQKEIILFVNGVYYFNPNLMCILDASSVRCF